MSHSTGLIDTSRCVRCGSCKALCPTYLTTHNEAMGARGRIAMLAKLKADGLDPSPNLAEKIFSCMLCGACKNVCPAGIDIPEEIYKSRAGLKKLFKKDRLLRSALKHLASHQDTAFTTLRWTRKLLRLKALRNMPDITARPFKNGIQVYKTEKRKGRIAVFAGCSVNYLYPELGSALLSILLAKGYEVVVFKGELCCGAPLRSAGYEGESVIIAQKNIEHFNRVRAEAIISLCPTCTMVIQHQYPGIAGDTIHNIMDVNEFIAKYEIADNLKVDHSIMTYHDPCHLNFGLGVREMPRNIMKKIDGLELVEMKGSDECCGLAGLFSMHFRNMSNEIGNKKIERISSTKAETVVTSCPGCMMQIQGMAKNSIPGLKVRHIVEIIDDAMHGES